MVRKRARSGKDHRAGTGHARRPRWLQEEAGQGTREGALQDQAERSLAVAEHEQRGHEDDQMHVEAPYR